jgi:hypothetical protein
MGVKRVSTEDRLRVPTTYTQTVQAPTHSQAPVLFATYYPQRLAIHGIIPSGHYLEVALSDVTPRSRVVTGHSNGQIRRRIRLLPSEVVYIDTQAAENE